MGGFTITRKIEAPVAAVFPVFTDFGRAPERVRGITALEIQTGGPVGQGTRFRETRLVFGRETTEELEVTAFEPGSSYTVQCTTCGCEFTTTFRFLPEGPATRVEAETRTRAITWSARLLAPLWLLTSGAARKSMREDIEDLARVVEGAEDKAIAPPASEGGAPSAERGPADASPSS